jgi:hypothetical protein
MSRCAMRRFDKHITADRPSNSALHQENQQRLSQLIQEREQIDKGQSVFQPTHIIESTIIENKATNVESTAYTPWKTPSSR